MRWPALHVVALALRIAFDIVMDTVERLTVAVVVRAQVVIVADFMRGHSIFLWAMNTALVSAHGIVAVTNRITVVVIPSENAFSVHTLVVSAIDVVIAYNGLEGAGEVFVARVDGARVVVVAQFITSSVHTFPVFALYVITSPLRVTSII